LRDKFATKSAPNIRRKLKAACWWFMAIILATWEAGIRTIAVQRQPRKIVHKILS
jgi:hypothetical protein